MSESVNGKTIGRPPLPKDEHIDKKFTVAFTAKEYLKLNEIALFYDCSMTKIVRRAVAEFLRVHVVVEK